jgi:hypothetical protein
MNRDMNEYLNWLYTDPDAIDILMGIQVARKGLGKPLGFTLEDYNTWPTSQDARQD